MAAETKGVLSLKKKLAGCEKTVSTMMCNLFFTDMPSMYKNTGVVDFLMFDLEHGSYNPENVADLLRACRDVDLPAIVRVPDYDYHCIARPLDMGADGILLPRTETLQQVENAIHAMRFFPKGKKGVGGRGLFRPGETVDDFNENRLLFLQIESPLGVQNLDEMLTKYGHEVAGILIGPNDMAVTSGCGLNLGADKVISQIREVIRICKAHNKSVGMFMSNGEVARWWDEGMNLLWVNTELGIFAVGLQDVVNRVKEL